MKRLIDNETFLAEIEQLLRQGHSVTVTVRGNSMRPFLADGRDAVTLQAATADDLKPGAVVLARDVAGRTVLHRLTAHDGGRLVLQGDGNRRQTELAEPGQVVGVATCFVRNGRKHAATGRVWQAYSAVMLRVAGWRRLRAKLAYLKHASDGYRKRIGLSCLAGLASVLLSLCFIYVSKRVIDVAAGDVAGRLGVEAVALAALVALQLLCDALDSRLSVAVQIDTGNGLRHRLFRRVLDSCWNAAERFHTGDVVGRIERDASSVVRLLTLSVPSLAVTGVQLLAAFAFFCYLDARLPWIVAGVFPFFLWGGRFYMKRMYGYTHRVRESDSRIQSVIQESLQHRTILKAFEQSGRRVRALDALQATLRGQLMQRTRFSIRARTCVSAAFAGGYLAAFLWGAAGLAAGTVTFGTMAAFLQLVGKVQRPILDLARLFPSLAEVLAAVDRLRELEELPDEAVGGQNCLEETPDIVMDDVGFGYGAGERPVIEHFSHRFRAGSCTAVAGETGRGKTTLVRLLLALAVPQQGQIRLCTLAASVPVSPQTRCNFVYVPQGNTLFSGTIRENLLMGNPQATEEEMREALRGAVADFVFSLPEGMDTVLGEQGGGLSEGQAQRIGIARALLRPGHILLLDEATSALDEETERQLVANLRRICAGKTLIFVTHHEAVRNACDDVVQL